MRIQLAAAVPVNDYSIEPPANHVRDLLVDLQRIIGAVTNINVITEAEPWHEMGVKLHSRSRIKQSCRRDFTDISTCDITVFQTAEAVRCTGIVGGFSSQGGSGL